MPPFPAVCDEPAEAASSRKAFLRTMGSGGGAAGLALLLSACGSKSQTASTPVVTDIGSDGTAKAPRGARTGGDIEIVNYALTLEHLEATFYAEAVNSGLLKGQGLALAKAFGETEREHVAALTATVKQLGGKPARRPRTNFALVIAGGAEMILQIAATVENLGASAYLGQAARIKDKDVLAAALAIHTVEARHAAALNALVGRPARGGSSLEGTTPDGAFPRPMTMTQVLAKAKPFIKS